MSDECLLKFNAPAGTINHLVIEYMKHILYYRGQFPEPLDQLKTFIRTLDSPETVKIGEHDIYSDENRSRHVHSKQNKSKQTFVDSIKKFDEFFKQLLAILQSEDVLEIVMHLGPNMMDPKELHRITLPQTEAAQLVSDSSSLQRYRLKFFKNLIQSEVLQAVNVEHPIPISVLLRLKDGVSLKEYMEQLRFYAPPKKCKQVVIKFEDDVKHECLLDQLDCFKEMTLCENMPAKKADLWVKLKSKLKGFKNLTETQSSFSSSNFV